MGGRGWLRILLMNLHKIGFGLGDRTLGLVIKIFSKLTFLK